MDLNCSLPYISQGQEGFLEFSWWLAEQTKMSWWSVKTYSTSRIQNVSPLSAVL